MTFDTWESLTLGDLGRWVTGSTPPSSDNASKGDDVLFVTPGDIGSGGKLGEVARRISNIGADRVRRIKPGSVILVCIGTIGKVAWTDREITTNQQINTLEVDQTKFDVKFVHWLLASPTIQQQLWQNSTSTTVALLNKKTLEKIPCSVPPLDEQRRIVETLDDHLSRLDKSLADLEHADSQTHLFRRSILNTLLNSQVSSSEPGIERMMSSFPTIALEDLLDTYIGGLWGEEPGRSEVDVKVMRITELGANGASDLATSATRSLTAKQIASRKLLEGDLVLEKSGGGPKTPVGRVALIGSLTQEVICSNFMLLMRPNRSQVLSKYLHHFLTYLHVTGQTIPLQSSSTNIRNISTPDYMQIQVPVPPLDDQRQIVETLDDHLSRLDSTRKSIASQKAWLASLRRAILNKAFNGELGSN